MWGKDMRPCRPADAARMRLLPTSRQAYQGAAAGAGAWARVRPAIQAGAGALLAALRAPPPPGSESAGAIPPPLFTATLS